MTTLQRPRSKSRTIIRMLTTKFSSTHANATPRSASTPSRGPPTAASAFGKEERDAALRERGLLPPLPSKDLSTQEMEQDLHIPIVHSSSSDAGHSPKSSAGNATEGEVPAPSAADLIKKEWEAKNQNVTADQRARMNSFKFGGTGSASPTFIPSGYPTSDLEGGDGNLIQQTAAVLPSPSVQADADLFITSEGPLPLANASTPRALPSTPPTPEVPATLPPPTQSAHPVTGADHTAPAPVLDPIPKPPSHAPRTSKSSSRSSSYSNRVLPTIPAPPLSFPSVPLLSLSIPTPAASSPAEIPLPPSPSPSPSPSPYSPSHFQSSFQLQPASPSAFQSQFQSYLAQPPSSPPNRTLPPIPASPAPSTRSTKSFRQQQQQQPPPSQQREESDVSGTATPRAVEQSGDLPLSASPRTTSRDDALPPSPAPSVPDNAPVISFSPPTVSSPAVASSPAAQADDSKTTALHMHADSFAQLEDALSASPTSMSASASMMMPSLSMDNASQSTTDSASLATPISPSSSAGPNAHRPPPPTPLVAKGKLGDLTVKTQHAQVPVLVESPAAGAERFELAVVVEEGSDSVELDLDADGYRSLSEEVKAPLSPNRVPAVTISPSPSSPPVPVPRAKKRGMTDPTGTSTVDRRKSLFGFKRSGASPSPSPSSTDGAAENQPQRRLSVAASLNNLRRSVVGTISASPASPRARRFDASHLPPSPTLPSSVHGGGGGRTVLAAGAPPQRRKPRMAVEPVMYSRGSIQLETANIEDEESRRMTELAFLG